MEPETIELSGMRLARVSSDELLDHIFSSLAEGLGGWVVTANLDILRRHAISPEARLLYDAADLIVADGMPLVWASRIQGQPLPERVAGSSLTPLLAERAAREKRTLYLLGGDPGAARGAQDELERRYPGLVICGCSSPWVSCPVTDEEMEPVLQELRDKSPDIILVALGSPKQEHVSRHIRRHLPGAWVMGVGISLSFIAGQVQRAPLLMQKAGLEWAHRLLQEPRRLARRYLLEDVPFAFVLLARALVGRRRRSRPGA